MYYTTDIVRATIIAQSLTRMTIYDGNSADKVFALDGEPERLCDEMERFVRMSPGMVRVECGTKDDKVARGGKSGPLGKRDPFVWRVEGGASKGSQPAPAPASTTDKAPAGYISEREHKLALENQRQADELKLLTHCDHGIHWSKVCADCDAMDTPPADDGTIEGVPRPDVLREYVTIFREVFGVGLRKPAAGTITGRQSDPDPAKMTEEDRATWAAIVSMRDQDPEQFEGYRKQLIELHGNKG